MFEYLKRFPCIVNIIKEYLKDCILVFHGGNLSLLVDGTWVSLCHQIYNFEAKLLVSSNTIQCFDSEKIMSLIDGVWKPIRSLVHIVPGIKWIFPSIVSLPQGLMLMGGKTRPRNKRNNPFIVSGICYRLNKEISPMNFPRYRHEVVTMDNRIYAIGGCGPDSYGCRDVEYYDLLEDKWVVCAPMQHARYGHKCIVHEGEIYVFGGYDRSASIWTDPEKYNPLKNTWEYCMRIGYRKDFGLISLGGYIYMVGGCESSDSHRFKKSTTVDCYDTKMLEWSICKHNSVFGLCDAGIWGLQN